MLKKRFFFNFKSYEFAKYLLFSIQTADRQGKSIEKHLKSKDGPTTKITSSGTPCSSSSPAGNSETPLCSKESTIGSSNYLKLDG